ncbi:MAG: LytR C-terminal domain-containing protein [Actinomycetota bacterium]|nr:LytR C-terminal domain-containing protein [Actinomycetota bacterium]
MGRHSSDQQWHFYRSVAGWLVPWLLVSAVAITAVSIAVDAIGGNSDGGLTPVAQSTPRGSEPPAAASPEPSPTVKAKKLKKSPAPSAEVELVTDGVSVQVLNGTGSPDADTRMADRLAGLGFDVYAVDSASAAYAQTTVFWSYDDARPAAEALAEKFGWASNEKPSNLSTSVALHIVVGADEA